MGARSPASNLHGNHTWYPPTHFTVTGRRAPCSGVMHGLCGLQSPQFFPISHSPAPGPDWNDLPSGPVSNTTSRMLPQVQRLAERGADPEVARSSLASGELPLNSPPAVSSMPKPRHHGTGSPHAAAGPIAGGAPDKGHRVGILVTSWSPAPAAAPPAGVGGRRLADHTGSGLCSGLLPRSWDALHCPLQAPTSTTFFTIQKSHPQTTARHTQKHN